MTTPEKSKKQKSGSGCLILFGLPFLIAGLFVMSTGVREWAKATDATDWEQTGATIQQVELEEHQGDDSTSYKVTASYSYHYKGKTYHGDEVGVRSGSDNLDDWHHETYATLKAARDEGAQVPCFVNPDDPEDSLLDREMRWGAFLFSTIFGSVFALVGGGISGAGVASVKRARAMAQRAEQNPDSPWLWREDWQAGIVQSSERWTTFILIGVAAVWNGVSWIAMIAVMDDLTSEPSPVWMVLLFPLIGIFLIVAAFRTWYRRSLIGKLKFRFSPMDLPFQRGGSVTGEVRSNSPKLAHLAENLQVGLFLTEVRTEKRGNKSHTSTHTLWSQMGDDLDPERHTEGTRVPVRLHVPTGHPDSDTEVSVMNFKSGSQIQWQVRLVGRANTALSAVKQSFVVPVFGEKAAADIEADDLRQDETSSDSSSEKPLNPDELSTLGVDRFELPTGGITYVRNGRGKTSTGVTMGVTATIMIIIGMVVVGEQARGFGIMFSLIAAVIGVIGIGIATSRSALTVDRQNGTLIKVSKTLGFRRQKSAPLDSIQSVTPKSTAEINGRPVYALRITTTENEFTAIGWLKEHHLAQRLGEQIEREVL